MLVISNTAEYWLFPLLITWLTGSSNVLAIQHHKSITLYTAFSRKDKNSKYSLYLIHMAFIAF